MPEIAEVPVDVVTADTAERWRSARIAISDVERFGYRLKGDAQAERSVRLADEILQMAKGLRRKLDSWRTEHGE